MMRRREFITLLGCAAAWPMVARGQQPQMQVIGFLGPALITRQHWLTAFRRGLGTEGFVEGQNVTIEYRSADGGVEELSKLAVELLQRQVAVIFASGPPAALAAKRSTQAIPIVFLSGGDPAQMGLVSSFHRPDGNVTGFYFLATELVAKRLALLHELLPRAERVAVLVNPTNAATAEPTTRDVAVAGRTLSLDIQVFNASTREEIDSAFAAFLRWRPDALFVGPDPLFNTERAQLVTLAARHALPASYFGVPEQCIEHLPPSRHTAAESSNLLDMARVRGWQNLIVSSLPHHQLRCFLQIVALIAHPYWCKVYNMTIGGISLMSTVSKPAWIDSQWPSVSAPLLDHFEEEFKRILLYAEEPNVIDGVAEFSRHATISEALAYVRWRDSQ
jgi:ABC-type uncharacterized transport system substrate-binding protein